MVVALNHQIGIIGFFQCSERCKKIYWITVHNDNNNKNTSKNYIFEVHGFN